MLKTPLNLVVLLSVLTATFHIVKAEVHAQEASEQPIIRSINIQIRDVFEGENLPAAYDFANSIKITTKQSIIKRELLFKEGEPFDQFLIESSERNLRSLGFLHRVSITPSFEENFVDIEIIVQDTWTLVPLLNLTSGSGSGDKLSVGVAEGNILGFGKRVELKYSERDETEEIQAIWEDRRLLGTNARLLGGYFDREDGFDTFGRINYPFRGLAQKKAWSISINDSDTVGSLFEAGDERFVFSTQSTNANLSYTWAHGDPDKLIHRITAGYRYNDDRFFEATEQDFDAIDVDPTTIDQELDLLAENRRFSAPFIGYERIVSDFYSVNYIDRFERVEDFNLGLTWRAQLGFAAEAIGSQEDTLLIDTGVTKGWRLDNQSFIRAEASIASRFAGKDFNNTFGHLEFKYYNPLDDLVIFGQNFGNHTLAIGSTLDVGHRLDLDNEFLLGANNGLRGFDAGTFSGDRRFTFNIEDRVHIFDDLWQLVSVGAATFLDLGGTSNGGIGTIFTEDLFADVGVGLRLNFPRSSSGKVLRFDLAFPLRDGPDGSNSFEVRLVLTANQIFSARTRSELSGSTRSVVDFGL